MDHVTFVPFLNLAGVGCPMAFVRARLFLDGIAAGTSAYILYEDTPANAPLARSIKALGHGVVSLSEAAITAASEGNPGLKDTLEMTRKTQLTVILVQVNSN